MTRLLTRLLAGFLCLSGLVAQPIRPGADLYRRTDRPNFVLIVADDLSPGDLGCYGGPSGQTPHLDRLASQGFVFDRAYAGGTTDASSRAALMTGLHAGHGPVQDDSEGPLRPEDITLAEMLRVASYPSATFGRWSLGGAGTAGHPLRQGFNEFFGVLDRASWTNEYPAALMRNEEPVWFPENERGLRRDYLPDWTVRASTNAFKFWLSRAFLVHVAMPLPAPLPGGTNVLRPEDPARLRRIREFDDRVGRIVEVLDLLQLGQHTHVIVTADQPGPPADPADHPWSEARLRVPLIIRPPVSLAGQQRMPEPLAAWDLMPTLAELARTGAPRRIDGRSFAPLLRGKQLRQAPGPLYWRGGGTNAWEAVRFGTWKAVLTATNAPLQLFDLETDAGETSDVASLHPDVLDEAGRHLEVARKPLPNPAASPGRVAPPQVRP